MLDLPHWSAAHILSCGLLMDCSLNVQEMGIYHFYFPTAAISLVLVLVCLGSVICGVAALKKDLHPGFGRSCVTE